MYQIKNLYQPQEFDELREIFHEKKKAVILGGCTFLKLSHKLIGHAVDLSKLPLNTISLENDEISIGAYVTYGDLERSELIQSTAQGIIASSISHIVGPQFRNSVTVGASVFSKYGFSDFLTALLILGTSVELLEGGRMTLHQFLQEPYRRDVLLNIRIPHRENIQASYQSIRRNANDFPMVNVAVSKYGGEYLIASGARPRRAKLAFNAGNFITENGIGTASLQEAEKIFLTEMKYGSNNLSSSAYRREMAKLLLRRALKEIHDADTIKSERERI